MDTLRPGARFLSYHLERCIGKGAFGNVWSAQQEGTGRVVAIKIELPTITKSIISIEGDILSDISPSPYFPQYYDSGTFQNLRYVILEYLGQSLRNFQESHADGVLTLNETCVLGVGMLRAIQEFHDRGYVHRDIKPANFVFRNQREHEVCLIDFGLAQRWRAPNGSPIPPRENVGFRGTARYASLNSHAGYDLGRRDDLWSLFFILVEFAAGRLPWRSQRDKQAVAQLKRVNLTRICTGLPQEFHEFLGHLSGLQFEDKPDYELLEGLLSRICEGADPDADWGACMSEQYGSMALIVATTGVGNSVMGSSSEVEGSWAVQGIAPIQDEQRNEAAAVTQEKKQQGTGEGKQNGCCLLL